MVEIQIVKNVLAENEVYADDVRKFLKQKNIFMLNLMSSPGSGKTKFLEVIIPKFLQKGIKVGVIQGDISTTNDAQRLQHLNIPISQINTEKFGGTCHLAANVIMGALEFFKDKTLDLIIIENVGNLVCPAEFDTGSHINIVMLSVTEGEDKPLKYPLMFRNSNIALISKMDLAKVVEADIDLIKKNMLQINPQIKIFETSAKSGDGLDAFITHILDLKVTFIKTNI